MSLIKGLYWWAYLDDQGMIHVKRYTNDRQIQNYEQLPFCKGIFDPFEAYDYAHAKQKCLEKYREIQYHEKKQSGEIIQ